MLNISYSLRDFRLVQMQRDSLEAEMGDTTHCHTDFIYSLKHRFQSVGNEKFCVTIRLGFYQKTVTRWRGGGGVGNVPKKC